MGYQPVRRAISLHFLRSLAEGQCLSLGKNVCDQHVVVAPDRIQGFREGNEVARTEMSALVDKLVE